VVNIESKLKEIGMVGLVEVRTKGSVVGFLELQESPSGTQLAARRHTRDASGALIHKKCCFSYFRRARTTRRWLCITRHKVPDCWALDVTIFFWFAQFS